ncbi:MAG: hypothetical protein U0457_17680 [Candidatus Sericytochromatia bacterium]
MSEDDNISYMDYIQEKLNLKFNKSIIRNTFHDIGLDEKSEEVKKLLLDLKISESSIKRWLREGYEAVSDKKYSFNAPRDEKQLLKLAGFLDIDPMLLISFDHENFAKIFKSLEGNILLGSILKWGKIHKNFMFLYKIFMPIKNFPSNEILELWNSLKETKEEWKTSEFKSSLALGDKEREKVISLKGDKKAKRQVLHLAYKKIKPLKEFEFWQEYKIIIIQPISDLPDFIEENKEKIAKVKSKSLKVVSVINVNGSFAQNIIEDDELFLIKTRFQEPETIFRVASFHNFEFSSNVSDMSGIKKVFDNPC